MDTRVIAAIALVATLLYLVLSYNYFIRQRHRVTNAWHQVEIQMESRNRLVDQLLALDASHAGQHREVITEILEARHRLAQAHGAREMAPGQAALHEAVRHYLIVVENYPDAPALNGNLVQQIARAEEKLCFTQQYYNDQVTRLNSKLSTVPSRWVGALAKMRSAELFDASPESAMPTPRA